ncbi:hypothetical protein IWZ00DRAFT_514471 [Phyllosticta capitalensis]
MAASRESGAGMDLGNVTGPNVVGAGGLVACRPTATILIVVHGTVMVSRAFSRERVRLRVGWVGDASAALLKLVGSVVTGAEELSSQAVHAVHAVHVLSWVGTILDLGTQHSRHHAVHGTLLADVDRALDIVAGVRQGSFANGSEIRHMKLESCQTKIIGKQSAGLQTFQ